MEKAFVKAEELSASVREYVQNRMDSVKLRVAEKSSTWIAQTVFIVLLSVVLILAAGFTGAALALLAGIWTGHLWMGLLLVALLFLIIAWILWLRREKGIRMPLVNYFLRQFSSGYEKNEES